VDVARLVHPELHLTGLGLPNGAPDVEGHGAQLGVGHEATRAQHLAQAPDLAHEVGGGDGGVEVHEAALDLLHQVLGADHVGAGLPGFALLVALGEHRHAHALADAVREHHGPANHLIGVLGVDAQAEGQVHRLVELGARHRLEGL
jgi:hypothetical protein